jgi:DNA-directed RNA polymerase specialized sigma24 family protein
MFPGDSLTALFNRLQAGDHAAAQPIWDRYFPRLVELARARLRGASRRVADEEDVALSAFDSFCRGAEQGHFPQLDDRDGLWALLARITVRKAADHANHYRRGVRGGGHVRGDSALAPPGSDGGCGFDEVAGDDPAPDVAAELAEEFQRLLARLEDPELRAIAVWRMEGYRNTEIARRLDCAEVTVERRLRLIRKLLDEGDGSEPRPWIIP